MCHELGALLLLCGSMLTCVSMLLRSMVWLWLVSGFCCRHGELLSITPRCARWLENRVGHVLVSSMRCRFAVRYALRSLYHWPTDEWLLSGSEHPLAHCSPPGISPSALKGRTCIAHCSCFRSCCAHFIKLCCPPCSPFPPCCSFLFLMRSRGRSAHPVSYTHLTLPTKRIV